MKQTTLKVKTGIKAGHEVAKEQFNKALQVMSQHVDRQSQVIRKITS